MRYRFKKNDLILTWYRDKTRDPRVGAWANYHWTADWKFLTLDLWVHKTHFSTTMTVCKHGRW